MREAHTKDGYNGPDGNLLVVFRSYFPLARYTHHLRELFILYKSNCGKLSQTFETQNEVEIHDLFSLKKSSRGRAGFERTNGLGHLLIIVSAVFLFGGCTHNNADRIVTNGSQNNARPQEDIQIEQGGMSASDLENTIRARLHDDELLNGADLNVVANPDRNEVTVSGVVETKVMRDRAIELARNTNSGLLVNDRIEVRQRELSSSEYSEENASEERERARERGESIGDSLDDARIHTMIVASLIGDRDLPQHKIKVDVKDNVVTLRGYVDTPGQKEQAERVARETEGVKRIINQLKVEKRSGNKSLAAEYS